MNLPNPRILLNDPRVRLKFGDATMAIAGGLQPSMLCTKTGALVVQSHLAEKAKPSKRMTFHSVLRTMVSRDRGVTWTQFPPPAEGGGLNLEGGAIQLRDGSILALDTYITPGSQPDSGSGQLYLSKDDWRTLEGPFDITFAVPAVNFHASSCDDGSPHAAVRLHRRILELPNGDLLTTFYGWMNSDTAPSGYMPTMKKSRVMLLRSTNRGRHWSLVATVAVDPAVGTEGYCEPVIVRVSAGAHVGRLICQMRTGRELRESFSDDEGRTWSAARPRVYADLDVYRTEKWIEMFRDVKDKHGNPIVSNPVELIGAVVDPDLLELRSGVIVAAFGVRVPPRSCWPLAQHPWNGTYLAFSLDHGETWSHVVQMTSGLLTTHYMALEAFPEDNSLYLTHDLGDWGSGLGRDTVGRTLEITVESK